MKNFKKKPASLTGAPITAQECQQLKAAFNERYPGQVPSVFVSRDHILNSIEELSNVSGIHFLFGLDDANSTASRRIILVPTRNRSNGESGTVNIISSKGYVCDNGERISFDNLLMLLGNHVTNFKGVERDMELSKLPRGYFWGISKILKLLDIEKSAGLVFHFGYNPAMPNACRRFQNVLEVVDARHNSLQKFMEWGQCNPPCNPCPPSEECYDFFLNMSYKKFLPDVANKLEVFRSFRDNWLLQQENGQALYELYYFFSRDLLVEIKDRPDQDAILENIYFNEFSTCVDLFEQTRYEEAKAYFIKMMQGLAEKYLMQDVATEVLAQSE